MNAFGIVLSVISVLLALACYTLVLVLRWLWIDRQQMRVQAKIFIKLCEEASKSDKLEDAFADFALQAWARARVEAVQYRGRREPF